jgi:hypothetical protein
MNKGVYGLQERCLNSCIHLLIFAFAGLLISQL